MVSQRHVIAEVALAATGFLTSFLLTGLFRRFALSHQLLDVPNARSSHTVLTPRGGGVAIVITSIASFLGLGMMSAIGSHIIMGLVVGGALVGVIGYIDDCGHVNAGIRLGVHALAAGWLLAWVGGPLHFDVRDAHLWVFLFGQCVAMLYIVWVINLTNFMDGIDGITGVEVITVCAGGTVLYLAAAPQSPSWIAPLSLATATLGFLVWNWPPARIFMGDTGSGYVGLMLAGFQLQAAQVSPVLFWSWLVLLGVFVVDATLTLVCRTLRGARPHQAHRTHAYQHAALLVGSHQPVTVGVCTVNIAWLLPIALLIALGKLPPLAGVIIAYTPLVVAAASLRAGVSTPGPS